MSEEVYVAVTLVPATALALIAPAPVTICHEPVVAALIGSLVVAVPGDMRERIHGPSYMPD